jgi:hypothetical protein
LLSKAILFLRKKGAETKQKGEKTTAAAAEAKNDILCFGQFFSSHALHSLARSIEI